MPTYLRLVTALSAAVTAVCAVVVAVAVISGNTTVRVEQLRTFDPVALSGEVLDLLRDRDRGSGVSGFDHASPPCPASVAIKEGVTFTCTFQDGIGKQVDVPVRVKDTYSGELELGIPTS